MPTVVNKTDMKSCCDNANNLKAYLQYKGRNHVSYKHYNKLPRLLNNIIDDKAFYLSDGTGWNDKLDSCYFLSQSVNSKLFGLCFSYDTEESVAMWMLYGGLEDKGAMINLTHKQILDLIDECKEIDLGHFTQKGKFKIEETVKEDYKIYLQDVLYYKHNEHARTNEIYRDFERKKSVSSIVLEGANPTLKRMPWSYEKEVRLIVEINKTELQNNCRFARIKISDALLKKISSRLYCSPKYDISVDKYQFNNYKDSGIKLNNSTLLNQIDWELK